MSLRAKVASALRWSIGGRLAAQALSWVSTLLVIRLLHPEDYGLMAMAMSVSALAMVLNDVGLTSAIVQKSDLRDDDIPGLLGATLLCNGALFALLFITAPWIARYYQSSELVSIMRVLALQFPIQSFGLIHASLLVRDLDFKTKSLVEAGALLTGSVSTLGLALAGFSVWALVFGALITAGLRSLGFSLLSPRRYRPSWRLVRVFPIVKFGGAIVAQRLVWWLYSQLDILLLGRLYQADAVGIYSIARQLAALPHDKVGAVLNQVTLASFARVQHDASRVRSHLMQATRMLAFIAVPVFAAISALAPEAIHVLLGRRWLAAVDPVRILALVIPLRMISAQISEVLNARGHPVFMLGNMFILLIIVGPALAVGSIHGGILGVCIAWAVGFPVAFAITTVRARHYTLVSLGDVVQVLARPLVGAAVMYITVELLRALLRSYVDPFPLFVLLTTAAAFSCAGTALLVDRSLLRDVLSFARA
jgi:teichuronic acid exporter